MSAADKLRDLHAAGTPLRNTAIVWQALPDIIAVIEAAENARDYAHDGNLYQNGQRCDWDEGELDPCPGCRLGGALAALNARLTDSAGGEA